MKLIAVISSLLALSACELPPPDLDSAAVQNPTCLVFCWSDFTNDSLDAVNAPNLSKTSTTTKTRSEPRTQ